MNKITITLGLKIEIRALLETGSVFYSCSKTVVVYLDHLGGGWGEEGKKRGMKK